MQVTDYRPRIADKLLAEHLSAFGAVCVEGPMWCGKTWTSMRQAASICPIGDSADNFATRRRVEMDIQYAFDGPEPRLIDEWQIVPAIWDATLRTRSASKLLASAAGLGKTVPVSAGDCFIQIIGADADGNWFGSPLMPFGASDDLTEEEE